MPLKSSQLFSLCKYIGTIPHFITWKKLDIWDNSLYFISFTSIEGNVGSTLIFLSFNSRLQLSKGGRKKTSVFTKKLELFVK